MAATFNIGITRDFYLNREVLDEWSIGLDVLDAAPGVSWRALPTWAPEVDPDHLRDLDGLYLRAGRLTAKSLGATLRTTYTFAPRLTLQVYGPSTSPIQTARAG